MTDTPETDNLARGNHVVPTEFAEKLERERDRLAKILQNIRSGYGGQIPDPGCHCGDCEFLIEVDKALQFQTL